MQTTAAMPARWRGRVQRLRLLGPVLLLGAVCTLAPPPASALALPAAVAVASCFDALNSNASGSEGCREPNAVASITLSPFVSMSAEASLPVPGLGSLSSASAQVTLRYSFEVVGGNPGDVVPLLVDTSLATNSGPVTLSTMALAEIALIDPSGRNLVQAGACTATLLAFCPPSFNTGSFSGSLAIGALAGGVYGVYMEIDASALDLPGVNALPFANAEADPLIRIDPAFAGAGRYGIALSPGVGNALPVPEPGAAVSLALGLAVVGFAGKLRRSRRSGPALTEAHPSRVCRCPEYEPAAAPRC